MCYGRPGKLVDVTMVGCRNTLLSKFQSRNSIHSEYINGIRISYCITDLELHPHLRISVIGGTHDIVIRYTSIIMGDKFRVMNEFINNIRRNTTIKPTDEIYTMILDVRQYLTYKLECILNVITRGHMLECTYTNNGYITNTIIDIFDASMTKSARK